MFLLNITMIADEAVHDEWLGWARGFLVPEMMSDNKLASSRILRVIDSPNDGQTYCLQFFAESEDAIGEILQKIYPGLLEISKEKFGQQVLAFTSVMEYVDL